MFDPTGMILADKATRRHVQSAQPKAPTMPESRSRRRHDTLRRMTAGVLRRLADRLEPQRCRVDTPATTTT